MTLCALWLDLEDDDDAARFCCSPQDFAAGVLATKIEEANWLLYRASGRQYPGECVYTDVRPCRGLSPLDGFRYVQVAGGGMYPLGACGCSSGGGCTAGGLVLPAGTRSVEAVTIDGTTLGTGEYRLVHGPLGPVLLRVDGGWPCHQRLDLPLGEPGTWSIDYTAGARPEPDGLGALAELACEMAKACTDGCECALPERLQTITREGMVQTILDPLEFLDDGKFGIRAVDQWLKNVNPAGLDRAGKWFSTATLDLSLYR